MTSTPPTTLDRPALGILLMLGFCLFIPFGDAIGKILAATFPVLMLVAARFAIQTVVLVPLSLAQLRHLPRTRRFWILTTLRATLHISGIWMMITALTHLPLADALAIAFVMPFLMLLLGKYVLGEEVGPRRIWACVVGFGGTLMVIQPSFAQVGLPALWPLGVAVVFSLFMLVTRQIAKSVDPIALQAVNGAQAVVVIAVIVLVVPGATTGWHWPVLALDWGLILAMGLIGTLAHLLMTWSLRLAPSATLAPMQYLEIPFATLIGYLIFREYPNGLAALGICVTMGTGLYIIWCEQQKSAQ